MACSSSISGWDGLPDVVLQVLASRLTWQDLSNARLACWHWCICISRCLASGNVRLRRDCQSWDLQLRTAARSLSDMRNLKVLLPQLLDHYPLNAAASNPRLPAQHLLQCSFLTRLDILQPHSQRLPAHSFHQEVSLPSPDLSRLTSLSSLSLQWNCRACESGISGVGVLTKLTSLKLLCTHEQGSAVVVGQLSSLRRLSGLQLFEVCLPTSRNETVLDGMYKQLPFLADLKQVTCLRLHGVLTPHPLGQAALASLSSLSLLHSLELGLRAPTTDIFDRNPSRHVSWSGVLPLFTQIQSLTLTLSRYPLGLWSDVCRLSQLTELKVLKFREREDQEDQAEPVLGAEVNVQVVGLVCPLVNLRRLQMQATMVDLLCLTSLTHLTYLDIEGSMALAGDGQVMSLSTLRDLKELSLVSVPSRQGEDFSLDSRALYHMAFGLSHLNSLNFCGIFRLQPLQIVMQGHSFQTSGIRPLDLFHSLSSLSFSNTAAAYATAWDLSTDVSWLRTSLTSLCLTNAHIPMPFQATRCPSPQPLSNLKNLRELCLSNCDVSLRPFLGLMPKELTKLVLVDCSVGDVVMRFVSTTFHQLRTLELVDCDEHMHHELGSTAVQGIGDLTKLTSLTLQLGPKPVYLGFLQTLEQLRHLALWLPGSSLDKLPNLDSLKQLTSLHFVVPDVRTQSSLTLMFQCALPFCRIRSQVSRNLEARPSPLLSPRD